jgi:hypothetical protein
MTRAIAAVAVAAKEATTIPNAASSRRPRERLSTFMRIPSQYGDREALPVAVVLATERKAKAAGQESAATTQVSR